MFLFKRMFQLAFLSLTLIFLYELLLHIIDQCIDSIDSFLLQHGLIAVVFVQRNRVAGDDQGLEGQAIIIVLDD
jgi:hypothetical protein